jgi:DNA-binding transcriptional LysR family regulator
MNLDRPGELAVFVRAVDAGGFSAAARQLDLTPSAVSKLVTRLEDRLGVRLLNRTTRSLSLTAEGEALFRRAQRILAEIEDAEREVTQARHAPRGLLRLSTGVAFGLHQLPPVLPEFGRRYPEIRIELSVTDRLVDLVDEGQDLAVRTGVLPDSTLVARRICDLERAICASPAYLKRYGTPRVPAELAHHNCLRMLGHPELSQWPFDSRSGVHTIEVGGNLAANNAETLLQMALLGLGIVRLGDIVLDAPVRRGELVPILTDVHHVEPVPMHAVMPPGRHRLPKVAAMVDFLVEKFASAPWRLRQRARPARSGRRPRA